MAWADICQAMIIGAGLTRIEAAAELAQAGIIADEDIVLLELSDVTGLSFDENAGVWTATTATTSGCTSSFRARTAVMTSGRPPDFGFPDVRGLDSYAGHKMYGAHWDRDYDLTGKRVGVIDAGVGVTQIVPELVKHAESVKLFQRIPSWVLPQPDTARTQKLFAKAPAVQQLLFNTLFRVHQANSSTPVRNTLLTALATQLAKAHLRASVKDPWLRRQLTPSPIQDCKRILVSSDYYPALQRGNCKLVDWPIATLSRAGIRTCDGVEHQLDAIVFDTAPNTFFLNGRNAWPGCSSPRAYIEGQLDYAVRDIAGPSD